MNPICNNPDTDAVFRTVADHLRKEINPLILSGQEAEAWRKSADAGLLSMGTDHSPMAMPEILASFYALGNACISGAFAFRVIAAWSASVMPAFHFGSDSIRAHCKTWMEGKKIPANAATEPGAGSNLVNMRSMALLQGNAYRIRAQKCFITNAHLADHLLLYVFTDPEKKLLGGMSVFILNRGEFTITSSDHLSGLESAPLSGLEVNDISVPADRMLSMPGAGFSIFNYSMNIERMVMSAMHLGILQRLLTITHEFISLPAGSGQGLNAWPEVEREWNTVKAAHDYLCSELMSAARKFPVHADRPWGPAARIKLICSEQVKTNALKLQQLFGATGFVRGTEIEQRVRDLLCSTVYSGTSGIMRKLISPF